MDQDKTNSIETASISHEQNTPIHARSVKLEQKCYIFDEIGFFPHLAAMFIGETRREKNTPLSRRRTEANPRLWPTAKVLGFIFWSIRSPLNSAAFHHSTTRSLRRKANHNVMQNFAVRQTIQPWNEADRAWAASVSLRILTHTRVGNTEAGSASSLTYFTVSTRFSRRPGPNRHSFGFI